MPLVIDLYVKGKVYKACVQSETWPIKVEDMQRLVTIQKMMIRWMCGVTLKNRISSEELYCHLDVEVVSDVVRRGRLRWFGHVERKSLTMRCLPVETWRLKELNGKGGVGNRGKSV